MVTKKKTPVKKETKLTEKKATKVTAKKKTSTGQTLYPNFRLMQKLRLQTLKVSLRNF